VRSNSIQRRLDIDAQLAQIDQAARLPELEEAFVKVAASWATRSRVSAVALREGGAGQRAQAGWPAVSSGPMVEVGCRPLSDGGRHRPEVSTLDCLPGSQRSRGLYGPSTGGHGERGGAQ
jgi:hypothetical protein